VEERGNKAIGDGDADHVALQHAVQVPGREAFKARIAITDLAEKTLDRQAYIRDPDATGHAPPSVWSGERIAGCGVRVRVLLDDINFQSRDRI
jgi:phosphatidylserine/phosphatidylglycerophosphate/cardiolipin synthase-like enzyme